MDVGVFEVQRLLALGHQAHQALTDLQAHPPHGLGSQANRLHQHQPIDAPVEKVEGAYVGAHRLADAAHHGGQGRFQVAGPVHLLNDTSQYLEHRRLLFHCGCLSPR